MAGMTPAFQLASGKPKTRRKPTTSLTSIAILRPKPCRRRLCHRILLTSRPCGRWSWNLIADEMISRVVRSASGQLLQAYGFALQKLRSWMARLRWMPVTIQASSNSRTCRRGHSSDYVSPTLWRRRFRPSRREQRSDMRLSKADSLPRHHSMLFQHYLYRSTCRTFSRMNYYSRVSPSVRPC